MLRNFSPTDTQTAVFAAGCFWCTEAAFEKLKGVKKITSGYAGGKKTDADYYKVASGKTDHRESIQVEYDPAQISYGDLVEIYWRNIDPTDAGGQFYDRGKQYTTVIFYQNDEEKKVAELSKQNLQNSGKFKTPIVTEILPLNSFFPAEEEHQNYHEKNPVRYGMYHQGSGRDRNFGEMWGKEEKL